MVRCTPANLNAEFQPVCLFLWKKKAISIKCILLAVVPMKEEQKEKSIFVCLILGLCSSLTLF